MEVIKERHMNSWYKCHVCGSILELTEDEKLEAMKGNVKCPICQNKISNEQKMHTTEQIIFD